MRASLHVSRATRVLYADTLESGWWAGVPQDENVSLSSARARVPPWPAPRPRARARRRPRSEQALLPRRARGPRRRAHHGGRGLLRRRRALREQRRGADDRVPPGLPGERPGGRPRLPRGGPRCRRPRQRRPRRAPVPPRLLRRLRARSRREQRRGGLPRTGASLGVLRRGRAGGKLTSPRGRQRHRRGTPAGPLGSLREPSSALPVLEDDHDATRLTPPARPPPSLMPATATPPTRAGKPSSATTTGTGRGSFSRRAERESPCSRGCATTAPPRRPCRRRRCPPPPAPGEALRGAAPANGCRGGGRALPASPPTRSARPARAGAPPWGPAARRAGARARAGGGRAPPSAPAA